MLIQLQPPTELFSTLARYLIEGKQRPHDPKRVAWVRAFNLPTDEHERVAHIMAATASKSARCTKPCYHAILAFALDEHPSPEEMIEVALDSVDLAGLGEHQIFMVGHGDKDHAHCHLMINRVHPDTGKAWSTSKDYELFDRIMKVVSVKHGFRYVPAHAFNPELTDELPKKPNSKATYAAKRGAATTRPQWPRSSSRAYGAAVAEELTTASTWDEVDHLLAEDGLAIEAKGDGFVVGDENAYSKLSALGLTVNASDLMQKLGPKPGPAKARRRSRRRSDGRPSSPPKNPVTPVPMPAALASPPPPTPPTNASRPVREPALPVVRGTPAFVLAKRPWRSAPVVRSHPPDLSIEEDALPPQQRRSHASVPYDIPEEFQRRPFWHVDAVDIARVIGTQDDVRRLIRASIAGRKARLQDAPIMEQLAEELREILRASTFLSPPKPKSPAARPSRPSARKGRSQTR